MTARAAILIALALSVGAAQRPAAQRPPTLPSVAGSCFMLLDTKTGGLTRDPADICTTRLPPASTFKIPHALAALDSGVLKDVNEVIPYDGAQY